MLFWQHKTPVTVLFLANDYKFIWGKVVLLGNVAELVDFFGIPDLVDLDRGV